MHTFLTILFLLVLAAVGIWAWSKGLFSSSMDYSGQPTRVSELRAGDQIRKEREDGSLVTGEVENGGFFQGGLYVNGRDGRERIEEEDRIWRQD